MTPPIAVLAPGQGAQTPRMLAPWLRAEGARAVVDAWSRRCDVDLSGLGSRGSARDLTPTSVAQPLLVTAGLLPLLASSGRIADRQSTAPRPAEVVLVGHSVGELTAAVYAGMLTPEDAVWLAAERGRAMEAACEIRPTGMRAALGGQRADVEKSAADYGLELATDNGGGQLVVAGPVGCLEAWAENLPTGVATRELAVAGAFHTRHMEPAVPQLAAALDSVSVRPATRPLVGNADGAQIHEPDELRRRLLAQLTSPVRWDRCVAALRERAVETALELPPAGTLSSLLSRQLGVVATRLAAPTSLRADTARRALAACWEDACACR